MLKIQVSLTFLLILGSLMVMWYSSRPLNETYNRIRPLNETYNRIRPLNETYNRIRPLNETYNRIRPSKTQILILSSWRSGSSFVGQLFNQNPHVFYLIEPAWHVWTSMRKKNSSYLQIPVRDLLRSIFSCNMSSFQPYLRRHKFVTDLFMWHDSRALCSPPACNAYERSDIIDRQICNQNCGNISFEQLGEVCNTYSNIVVKSVRIFDLNVLYPLLKDPLLNLKIIHLVRDPRAVLYSRENFDALYQDDQTVTGITYRSPDIFQVMQEICRAQVRIYNSFIQDPPEFLKGRYVMVRYEDLVHDPVGHVKDWYTFAGLSMSLKLQSWIYNITHGKMANDNAKHFLPLSGKSAEIAQLWREKLAFSKLVKLQNICKQEMEVFGYKMIMSVQEQKNMSLQVVLPKGVNP